MYYIIMPLLSIFDTPTSHAIIIPNIKSYETVLEFLACDSQTVRRTEEKSGILRWVPHLKPFDICS